MLHCYKHNKILKLLAFKCPRECKNQGVRFSGDFVKENKNNFCILKIPNPFESKNNLPQSIIHISQYLNRLSDFFFVLARYYSHNETIKPH